MTTGGREPEPGAPLVPNDPLAVAELQQALVDQGFSVGTSGPEADGGPSSGGRVPGNGIVPASVTASHSSLTLAAIAGSVSALHAAK
jgi:hypothetical protein